MLTLHYGKLSPVAFSATTAAVGFPAANLGNESLVRPYRATGVGATDVILSLAAVATIKTLFLHDVNFANAQVYRSPDGVAWTLVGTLNTYADRYGRRRGLININQAGQLAVKISIGAGASTDGLAWRIGAPYLFTASVALGAAAEYGYQVSTRRPRVSVDLPNGRVAQASTGMNVDRINLSFPRQASESVDDLVQRASVASCVLDLGLPLYPEQVWPVRCPEASLDESFNRKTISSIGVPLLEIV